MHLVNISWEQSLVWLPWIKNITVTILRLKVFWRPCIQTIFLCISRMWDFKSLNVCLFTGIFCIAQCYSSKLILLRVLSNLYGKQWSMCPEVGLLGLFLLCDKRIVRGKCRRVGKLLPGCLTGAGGAIRSTPGLQHGCVGNSTERMVHHWHSAGHLIGQSAAEHRAPRRWVCRTSETAVDFFLDPHCLKSLIM